MSIQTPFFNAAVIIGNGMPIPAQPGARLSNPLNYAAPPIIGNTYQWNYGPGVRQPSVDINLICRDIADTDNSGTGLGEAFGSSLLYSFFSRTTDGAFDTYAVGTESAPTGTVTYWDGVSGFTLTGAKAESFTLSCSKGDDLIMSCRFVFTGATTLGAAPTLPTWSSAPLLKFNSLSFASALANLPWSFSLSYANNHTPNMALNGSVYPVAWNAGIPTAGFNMKVQAVDTVPVNGTPIEITITGAASGKSRNFTINNPLNNTPDDRNITAPRVFRDHTYLCLGIAGRDASGSPGGNAPLSWS